jgi:ABC-type transport system involved in multi-copper enzyme maturation permease subunit
MSERASDRATVRRRQVLTLAVFELGRSALSRRALVAWSLAAMPVFLALLRAIFLSDVERAARTSHITEFAPVFHYFQLRFIVFFGCAFLFVKLFRGEILERSFHYSLLAPVKRELLVLGKYLGGLLSALLVFVPTVIATQLLFAIPHGVQPTLRYLGSGGGLGHMASYVLVVVLACLGYGAVFMLAGLFFKNPMVPAILLLGWEILTPFLPTFLKVISLVHYLSSVAPVPVTAGPFALIAQPVAPWLAVLAVVAASAAFLALAAWKAKRLEISYASE